MNKEEIIKAMQDAHGREYLNAWEVVAILRAAMEEVGFTEDSVKTFTEEAEQTGEYAIGQLLLVAFPEAEENEILQS